MVILKKVKAASLVETLIASVIIVIVFMIASFSFNNVFVNSIKKEDSVLQNRLKEITYFSRHDKQEFPFYEEGDYWQISGEKNGEEVVLEIKNTRKDKTWQVTIIKD